MSCCVLAQASPGLAGTQALLVQSALLEQQSAFVGVLCISARVIFSRHHFRYRDVAVDQTLESLQERWVASKK